MHKLLLALVAVFVFYGTAMSQCTKVLGVAERSNVVVTSGINSSTKAPRSYPGATIDIYLAGTLTHAAIWSNSACSTVKSNPFTTNTFAEYDFFILSGTSFDVAVSGTGVTTPYTLAGYTSPGSTPTGATPGTYTYSTITIGADGRVTSASSGVAPAFPAGPTTEHQYRVSGSAFGASTVKQNTTTLATQITTPVLDSGTIARAYGDSITKGTTGPSSLPNSYAVLLATAKGWTLTNTAVDGAMIPDVAEAVYATTVGTDYAQFWLQDGTNDQRTYGTSDLALRVFREGHAALLTYLAIPHASKILGTDTSKITYTGTWANSPVGNPWQTQIGRTSTNAAGSTATFTVSGRAIYIGTLYQHGATPNNATYSIAVDGGTAVTYPVDPGFLMGTVLGNHTWGPRLIRIAGLSEGFHTVVLTVVSAPAAGDAVYLSWVAGSGGVNQLTGPNVYVGNVPRFTAAGYVAVGGSDANVKLYNRAIRANVNMLQGDGLNIALVDGSSYLDPAVDTTGDGVHLNDAANVKLANAYKFVMDTMSLARDRQAVATFNYDIHSPASSATPLFEFGMGSVLSYTLTANVTSVTYGNIPIGRPILIYLTQGGAGSFTFAWGTSVKWVGATAPTLSTAVGRIDIFQFISRDGIILQEVSRALDVR